MSSSQYNTCSALQRSSQGVQPWNPEQTPLTEWASWIPSNPKKKLTIHVRRLCCSRAPRAVQQRVPLDHSLQCSLVHGSGRLFPTPLTELDRRSRGTRPQDIFFRPTPLGFRQVVQHVLFFPSNASWLSPGRSTCSIACCSEE